MFFRGAYASLAEERAAASLVAPSFEGIGW
jgi:hypothetical protein